MKRKLDPYTLRWAARWHTKESKLADLEAADWNEAGAPFSADRAEHSADLNREWAKSFREKASALTKTPKAARKRNG